MKILNRTKPYKTKPALETINNIRSILNDLDIFTFENHEQYGEGLHSCHVSVDNINVGTNGKGISRRYSLASAYGEFIERLQNKMLFHPILNLDLYKGNSKFSFFPDEKYLSSEELLLECPAALSALFNTREIEKVKPKLIDYELANSSKHLCLPYYSLKGNRVKNLPVNFLRWCVTSNGMAAGNSEYEALVQGTCEIIERYVIAKIYNKSLSLPTIPSDFFKGTKVYEIINSISLETKYEIVIKDCSLGVDLPCVGIIIIDKLINMYTFHLGADPDTTIALERCLTEVYQGDFRERMTELNLSLDPFFPRDNLTRDDLIRKNLDKTIINGTGKWPNSIFDSKSDFALRSFVEVESTNEKDDFVYITDLLESLGYEILIRDNSYLGFPTYHIYIPGMSEHSNKLDNVSWDLLSNFTRASRLIKRINVIGPTDLLFLSNYLENAISYFSSIRKKRFLAKLISVPNKNRVLDSLSIELLLVMINYKLRIDQKAHDIMKKYLEDYIIDVGTAPMYYQCIKDFLWHKTLKNKLRSNLDEEQFLLQFYEKRIASKVLSDMSNPDNVFAYIVLPNDSDCGACDLASDCHFDEYKNYVTKIDNILNDNAINQKTAIEELILNEN